jgi:hypothetical protein
MKETRSRKKSSRQADAIGTRASRNSQIYNLTLDIHNLRQELYDLELRRAMLHTRSFYSRADSPMSILRVVGRYFHGFANGYRGPCTRNEVSWGPHVLSRCCMQVPVNTSRHTCIQPAVWRPRSRQKGPIPPMAERYYRWVRYEVGGFLRLYNGWWRGREANDERRTCTDVGVVYSTHCPTQQQSLLSAS